MWCGRSAIAKTDQLSSGRRQERISAMLWLFAWIHRRNAIPLPEYNLTLNIGEPTCIMYVDPNCLVSTSQKRNNDDEKDSVKTPSIWSFLTPRDSQRNTGLDSKMDGQFPCEKSNLSLQPNTLYQMQDTFAMAARNQCDLNQSINPGFLKWPK